MLMLFSVNVGVISNRRVSMFETPWKK